MRYVIGANSGCSAQAQLSVQCLNNNIKKATAGKAAVLIYIDMPKHLIQNSNIMQNKHYCFLLLIISCLILSCSDNEHLSIDINKKELPRKNGVSNTYYIGFDLRWDPVEDVKFYLPLLHHLSSETGYNFKFKIPRSYQENIYMLGNGSVDLSLMGSVSCMIANIQFGAEPIVVGLNSNGKPYYKSVIIKKIYGSFDKKYS